MEWHGCRAIIEDKEVPAVAEKRFWNAKRREIALFYVLVAPFVILFIATKLVPFVNGLYLSLTNYTGYNYDRVEFVGVNNYQRVFTDAQAMSSLGRTFLIGCITVPLGLIVGLGCALLLNKARKGLGVFRTIIYMPSIIPTVAAGLMWRIIFNANEGLLNKFLGIFGINPVNWLGYDHILAALVIMMTWGSTGGLLLNLAALQGIPNELYEAAALDGAGGWKKFTKITLPMISPILFFNLVMGIIGGFQLYAQPVLLAPGSNGVLNLPLKPTYTYMVHAYQQILGYSRFGYGLAMMWVLVFIINILTVIVTKTQKYWVFYSD